jgi:hypothetical protein
MNTCAAFLTASRRVAQKNKSWTDRACGVLQSGDYYFVESYEGKIVWEGKAHCKYCARAEAISHMAGKEEAA